MASETEKIAVFKTQKSNYGSVRCLKKQINGNWTYYNFATQYVQKNQWMLITVLNTWKFRFPGTFTILSNIVI